MTAIRRSGERGFTLVEMLVALAMLGFVLWLIGSGAGILRVTSDRLGARGEGLADLTLFASILHDRLGDAVALEFGPAGRTVASFEGGSESVRFLTLAHEAQAGAPILAMEIGLREEPGVWLGLAPFVADLTGFEPLDMPGVEQRLLMEGAGGLELAYFGRKEGAEPAWYSEWRDEPRLPRAVRVEVRDANPQLPPIIVPILQQLSTLCTTPEPEQVCPEP